MIFFFLKENLEIVAPSGIKGMKMKSCIDSQQLKNSVQDSILLTSTICCKKFKLLGPVQFCSSPCPLGFSLNCIFSPRFSQLFALQHIGFSKSFYTTRLLVVFLARKSFDLKPKCPCESFGKQGDRERSTIIPPSCQTFPSSLSPSRCRIGVTLEYN